MKNILLVCAAGMSTSLMVTKMKDAAVKKGIDVNIEALPVSECQRVINDVDIVLIGPQVRFEKENIEKLANGRIPVEIIDMRLYGTMNGEAILDSAMAKIS